MRWRVPLLLLATYALVGVAVLALAWVTPAYRGDLTRLGGYNERDFAWRAPQAHFVPMRYTTDRIEPGLDLLVIGDSMSLHRPGEQTDPGSYWPNWLAARSGWRIAALRSTEVRLDRVLNDPRYRSGPPRVLVYQLSERTVPFLTRFAQTNVKRQGCTAPPRAVPGTKLRRAERVAAPQSLQPPHVDRPSRSLSVAGHRLKQTILGLVMPSHSQTRHFALARVDRFSSRRTDTLLVYRDDLDTVSSSDAQIAEAVCALRAMQADVEADGRTRFAVVIVPDKLSAYRRDLQTPPADDPERLPAVHTALRAAAPDLVMPRLDAAFAAALDAGTRDLFLPNDSHLGAAGQQVLAETLYAELLARGAVAP